MSRTAPERRAEALIAAYIHELSPRHDAEREAGEADRRMADARMNARYRSS